MKTTDRLVGFFWTVAVVCGWQTLAGAQSAAQPPEGTPAPSNINQSGYPRILPDDRVAFRVLHLKIQFASFHGGHEWQVWRKSLYDFAQRIFK